MFLSFRARNLSGILGCGNLRISKVLQHRYKSRVPCPRGLARTYFLACKGRITGFVRVISLFKTFFLALFDIEDKDVYRADDSEHLFYPHLEEYIAGVALFRKRNIDAQSLRQAKRCRGSVGILGMYAVVLCRKPILLDLEYVVLQLGQSAALRILIHNPLTRKILSWLPQKGLELKPDTPYISTSPPRSPPAISSIISIIDSDQDHAYALYRETLGNALRQFGFFFQELDLSKPAFTLENCQNASLIVLGQQGILRSLSERSALEGLNILNCDHWSLRDDRIREKWLPGKTLIEKTSRSIAIERSSVTVSLGEKVVFFCASDLQQSIQMLPFRLDSGAPFCFPHKESGVYHCLLDQTSIAEQTFGSLNESAFFFRHLIAETARKPLILKECPRFLFLKLDDITLEQSKDHLLEISRTGLYANVGLFMFDVPADNLAPFAKGGHPGLRFTPHSGGWKHAFWKDAIHKADLSHDALSTHTAFIRTYFEHFQLEHSPVTHTHFYAIGENATPYLKSLGIRASIMSNTPESRQFNLPIGHPSYGYGEHTDGLFRLSFEDHNHYKYDSRNTWDFLKRCTTVTGKGDAIKVLLEWG